MLKSIANDRLHDHDTPILACDGDSRVRLWETQQRVVVSKNVPCPRHRHMSRCHRRCNMKVWQKSLEGARGHKCPVLNFTVRDTNPSFPRMRTPEHPFW